MSKEKQKSTDTAEKAAAAKGAPAKASPAKPAPTAKQAVEPKVTPAKVVRVPVDRTFKLESYQVLLRPLVTEKGVHRSNRNNQYSFEISPFANKVDVKKAVESLFEVKVKKVCTQNRRGKTRRHRFRAGYTRDWKKAIVTLHEDNRIDFF